MTELPLLGPAQTRAYPLYVKIRYTNTVEHLAAFQRFHLSRSPAMRWMRWRIPLIVAFLIVLCGVRMGRPGETKYIAFFTTIAVLFLVFNALFSALNARVITRRLVAEGENRGVLCEHVLEITPDSLIETTPVSELRSKWISAVPHARTPTQSPGRALPVPVAPATDK